jgi:ATP-dependent RNA helicase DDX52/ROK1
VLAIAPTGSGKTAAFLVPIIQSLLQSPSAAGFRALVVAPTKELAHQIYREALKLIGDTGLGVFFLTQHNGNILKPGTGRRDVLVTTPLRLVSILEHKTHILDFGSVESIVFDEGDKLLEPEFVRQVDRLLLACSNPLLKKIIVSATLPPFVEELAASILSDPIKIIVGARNSACTDVQQSLVYVGEEDGKLHALRNLLLGGVKPPVLVFVQSKDRAKQLTKALSERDSVYSPRIGCIHADQAFERREQVIKAFRTGQVWVLICTELIARGVDFKAVNCVVNYDFPQTTISYIHRIGRTGRAGRSGTAVTFFTNQDGEFLRSIVNVMKISGCDVPEWMLSLKKPS